MTWKELSTVCHCHKVDLILSSDYLIMHCCSWCVSDDVKCVVSDVLNLCALCYQHNWSCDLAPLTLKLTHTLQEKEQVNSELLTAEAKAICLQKQKYLLQKWLCQLDDQEIKNIKELKKNETHAEAATSAETSAALLFSEEELQTVWTPSWLESLLIDDSSSWCADIHWDSL